jgi:Rhodopirellula transposase DDE domain
MTDGKAATRSEEDQAADAPEPPGKYEHAASAQAKQGMSGSGKPENKPGKRTSDSPSERYRINVWYRAVKIPAHKESDTLLEVWVCHFPPGTSKWNKIEHRLFCHITRTWRARPLMTKEDAVAGIAATTTYQGLKVTAVLDENDYPTGREVSGERMEYLEERVLDRQDMHGEWNYAVLPVPRPAPEPEPEPEPAGPDPALLEGLAVLAGVPAPQDLLAQLSLHWHAGREYRLTLRRGHERRTRREKTAYRKLSPQAILVAAACRIRLRMTWTLLSQILGVHHSTISVPASHAIPILRQHGITAEPDAPRITTPRQLREHAAAAAITLTLPGQAAGPAQPAQTQHQTPTTRPRTPT